MFVGRAAYLAELEASAREAAMGRPRVVLVEGEAGVGKSALVRHWLADVTRNRMTILRAFCDAAEQDLSYGVVGQLLAAAPDHARNEFPLLADAPSADAAPYLVGAQFLALLDRLQERRPVAVVVDDVQWADEPSLRTLGFALRRLEADAVMAVLATRRGGPDETGTSEDIRRLVRSHPGSRQVRLEGLDVGEVAQLAQGVTGRAVFPQMAARLRKRTDGNPLYVRALLADSLHEDMTDGHPPWPVPPPLVQAVHRQLAGLPEQARHLAEAAAILDARLPLAVVGQVAGVPDAAAALPPALASGLVRWWPNDPATPVAIGHELQRDAVIEALTPSRRQALHGRAAEVVDAVASWRHRVAATTGADPRLAAELEKEAGRLLSSHQVERATTLLLWAADIAGARIEYERLLLTAAAQLMAVDHFARVQPLVETARTCAPCSLRDVVLGSWACCVGDTAGGRRMLMRALETTETRRGEEWIAAIAARWLVSVGGLTGEGELAVSAGRRALALKSPDRRITERIKGDIVLGRAAMDGPLAGLRELDEIAPLPSDERVREDDAYLLMYRGMLRACAGRRTEAADDLTAALRLGNRTGYVAAPESAHITLSTIHHSLGRWSDATLHAERAIDVADAEARRWMRAAAHSVAAWVPAGRGEWRRAEDLLRTAEEEAQAFPLGQVNATFLAVGKSTLAQAHGDRAGMLAALEELLRIPEQGQVTLTQLSWRPMYAEALIGTGRLDDADRALSRMRDLAHGMPTLRVVNAWLAGELAEARGDDQCAAECYKEGLALPSTPDDIPLHRASLEQAYGRLLARTGERRLAETWLHRAADGFTALGARPFLDRCNAVLGSLPTSPYVAPRPPELVLSPLTDRERDIAHLVSLGLTNNEIAAELFISVKTVEYHLGHIYQKFGFTSRRQLRDHIHGY